LSPGNSKGTLKSFTVAGTWDLMVRHAKSGSAPGYPDAFRHPILLEHGSAGYPKEILHFARTIKIPLKLELQIEECIIADRCRPTLAR
jgi:hypothetical protein